MPRRSTKNSENAAWRLIFGTPVKYNKSFKPRNIPNAPKKLSLPEEARVQNWTSPWAQRKNLFANNSSSKKYSTIVVNSARPITNSQHNKLVNDIRAVTAV